MELLLILIVFILMISSSIYVKSTYNKYDKIANCKELSGFEVARQILDNNGLKKIHIVETTGLLSDHYDPTRKVVRLSRSVFDGTSISAIAIASHECGHAIQDKENYMFLKIRSFIFPIVSLADKLVYPLLIVGFILEFLDLVYFALALMLFGLLFQLVTLPVEFNASSKAKKALNKLQLVRTNEESGVNAVLKSAAFTYIAGTLATLLNILRLFLSTRDN